MKHKHCTKALFKTAVATLVLSSSVHAAEYFVSPTGTDDALRSGAINEPFATLDYALSKVAAGDTVYLRQGTYSEVLTRNDVTGDINNRITISAYNGEKVTFDGTISLTNGWDQHSGDIYKTTVSSPVWQLFVNGEQMVPARWPNANFDDGSIYTDTVWAKVIETGSGVDHLITDPNYHNLDTSGIDAKGATIIANVGSFITYTRKVIDQQGNALDIEATPNFRKHPKYYLEGKLELLDQEKEWFFDTTSNTVYLWAENGGKPTGEVKGKANGYVFNVKRWSYVDIRDIDFFATTITCNDCDNVTFENLDLKYGGSSQRMLGYTDTKGQMFRVVSNVVDSGIVIRNVNVSDTDSQALVLKADNAVVENSSFINIDYAAADTYTPGANVVSQGTANTFRYNTIKTGGNSTGIATNGYVTVEYNDISDVGFAQNDGALIQIGIDEQPNTIMRYNWAYDAPGKYGLRFDAPNPQTVWGNNGFMHDNVTWNAKGLMVKGEYNRVYHNLAFDNEAIDLRVMNDGGANNGTQTVGNAADSISGERSNHVAVPGIVGTNFDELVTGLSLTDSLRDVSNRDFRPKAGSELVDAADVIADADYAQESLGNGPDLGSYEFGSDFYWIPGQKQNQASKPIPADGNSADEQADLIWQQAYQASEHHLYFGSNLAAVTNATLLSSEYKNTFVDGNIFDPGQLTFGTYYWRVDANVDGQVIKGKVWSFVVDRNYQAPPTVTPPAVKEDLMLEDFESNLSNWTTTGTGVVRVKAAATDGTYGVRLKATSSMKTGIDTTGYENIELVFDARSQNMESTEYLKFDWSADGVNWQTVDKTNGTTWSNWVLPLPAAAANNPNLKIRFKTNADANNERGELDTLAVRGTAI